MSGKQIGNLLDNTDKNSGALMGQYLAAYKSPSWPPHFRSTVGILRHFLRSKFGETQKWSKVHFLAQQTYFNHIMQLDKEKVWKLIEWKSSPKVFDY